MENSSSAARNYPLYKLAGLILGPVLFVLVLLLTPPTDAARTAAVAVLMATWWITEAIPIAATALLPLALFPLLGVMPAAGVASSFGDKVIFLFAGGFFIAMAIQKWNLHERIALNVIRRVGTDPKQLVLGFMIATALLSMWISNTATTLMMLPIALAVIGELQGDQTPQRTTNFSIALLLGVAYSASIGGVGTLIGSPPNILMAGMLESLYPGAPPIGFLQWMLVGVPFVIIFLPIAWILLTRFLYPPETPQHGTAREEIDRRIEALGPMSRGERIVLTVSAMTALGWIFRADIDLGFILIPGWSNLFPDPDMLHDSTVAVFFAIALFAIPVNWEKREFALDWEWAKRIPWGILLLFGGGLALAKASNDSGLVLLLGEQLNIFSELPLLGAILSVCLLMTFLTELTSNLATTAMMVPILAATATDALHANPLLLLLPATISASCAFMLPVATPPNAIVFGGGHLSIPQMAKAGLILNLIGALLITALVYFLGITVFGIEIGEMPAWAVPPS